MTLQPNVQPARRLARLGTILTAALLLFGATACGGSAPADPATPPPTSDSPGASATATRPATGGPASGPAGTLDPTFGEGGRVLTDFTGRKDEVYAVVVQPDGKIVAEGETWVYPQDRPRIGLARYNADGSLDSTFGDGGHVTAGMTDDEWDYTSVHTLALLPDGRLLVAGTTYSQEAGRNVFAVARFQADGTLDATFGSGGRTLTPVDTSDEAGNDEAYAMAVGPDGQIVLAGVTGNFPANFATARFQADGTLDTTFGNGGTVVTDLGGDDKAAAVAIQPDGKIVVAGRGANNDDDWAMLRYLPNGELDPAFGTAGQVVTDFKGGEDWVGGLLLRPDGKILVGGAALIGHVLCTGTDGVTRGCDKFGFALVQYGPNGKPDKKFGTGGQALYEFDRTAGAAALALQPDGKIVLAGHYDYDDFAVVRANADGSRDTTFGTDGLTRTPFSRAMDVAYAVALQPDGQIVAAGAGTLNDDDPLNDNFALTRYTGR